MKRVYIAIGSNLDDPITKAKQGIAALQSLPNSTFVKSSSLYTSKPMGPQDQPDYVNAVVAIDTQLSPIDLLDKTQAIELTLGRIRKDERWGPRTLDLDLLLYANETIDSPRLTIPHYGMKVREFVLYPLAEIAPNLHFPDGTSLNSLLKKVDRNALEIIS